MLGARASALLGALLVVAGAASAVAIDGTFTESAQAWARGDVIVTADHAALDLAPAAEAWQGPILSWSKATAQVLTSTRDYVLGAAYVGEETATTWESYGAGTLQDIQCAGSCKLMLFTTNGTFTLEGFVDGVLTRTPSAFAYWTGWANAGASDAFHYQVDAGWYNFSSGLASGPHAPLHDAHVLAEGDVGVLLWGVSGTLVTEGNAEPYRTGTWTEPTSGPLDLSTGHRSHRRSVVLHLEDVRLDLAAASPFAMQAKDPRIEVDGALVVPSASGMLRVDGRHHPLDGTRVLAVGDLALQDSDDALTLRGDATRLVVSGTTLVDAPSNVARPARTAAALVLLGVALYLAGIPGAFYTRLDRATLLEHPTREQILGVIRARPTIHTAGIVRATSLNESVVRHHLRILTDHGLIRGDRKRGRTIFVSSDARVATEMEALHDPTRRRIALALRESPDPPTQAELAQRTGVSRRLVSYHLGELCKEGLATARGTWPRRYHASDAIDTLATRDAAS